MSAKGSSYVRKTLPSILEDAENHLTSFFRELLLELYEEMVHLDERMVSLQKRLEQIS